MNQFLNNYINNIEKYNIDNIEDYIKKQIIDFSHQIQCR